MASVDNTLLYVAIDFGTTFSGYAFQFRNKTEIVVNRNWGQALGCAAYKVPTCVVTDESNEFVAFGYKAQEMYTDNNEDSDEDNDSPEVEKSREQNPKRVLHYYDEFKMELQKEKGINVHMKLKSYDGHQCEALEIFAMALRFLKKDLLENIGQYTLTIPKDDEIKWILTVPAIWSDGAKQFMRECSVKAELVSTLSSEKLLIALEPEAASLHCRTLPFVDFRVKENAKDKGIEDGLPRDSHYLVVDCGGGTVDVTAHHYKKEGDICELYAASGGGWGGRNINILFEEKVDQVLGEGTVKTFKKKLSSAYLDKKVQFEKEKRSIDFNKKVVKYQFDWGWTFNTLCQQINGNKSIGAIVKLNQAKHGVLFANGYLQFPKDALLEMFSPSIEKIKNHIMKLIRKRDLRQIKYIYLVGGFSDCSLLQSVITKEFEGKDIHVILAPFEASLAVVKGAVKFGSNPQAISSRRTRSYYCTDERQSVHPSKRNRSNRRGGRKALVTIVEQNIEIYNDDCKCTVFYPYDEGNIFKLYHYKHDSDTHRPRTKYSTDSDVDVINVNLSNVIGPNCTDDARISVYLYFGSTELHVTARNDKNPAMKQTSESFDCLEHEDLKMN